MNPLDPLDLLDLLIIGAGPTGLAAAVEAARHGLRVRVVDDKPGRASVSRALVVHARTLEAFEDMGLAAAVCAAGVPFAALNVTPVPGKPPIRVDLRALPWGDTRYPFWLSIPQYATERCLEQRLAALGVRVDWSTRFVGLAERDDHVEVALRGPGDVATTARARWLLGCDGGRSPVREAAGLGFVRTSLDQTFILADALGDPGLPEDEGAAVLARDGLLFVVPMPEPGRWRIIAHLARHRGDAPVVVDAPLLDHLLHARLGVRFAARDLSWTSQFILKQGLAARYRAGRVFIAGDAAHLHSPVGGQGLNTGVQDAHALIWRLALAERARPTHDALLASYEAERRPIAARMVRTTGLATRLMTLRAGLLTALRGRIARVALQRRCVQRRLGRPLGMLDLAVTRSPIVLPGRAAGRRLPDPPHGAARLRERLDPLRHTLLVLDDSPAGAHFVADLRAAGHPCVHIGPDWPDPDGGLRARLGGARLVIVRPDRIVAAAATTLDPDLLARYARALGVAPAAL